MIILSIGCAPKMSSHDLSASLDTNSTELVIEAMKLDENAKDEMWHNLNIARLLQSQGQYAESIKYFQIAEAILDEYEARAKVSVRNIGSGAGATFLSIGAGKYYGKGYERTLMHTLNGLNYIMLGDFEGGAIEMRKMEKRQEFWLAESEARIKEAAEKRSKQPELQNANISGQPPEQYSMRALLEDPEVKSMINNYQDPFSYTLSAITTAIAGDKEYSQVSCRRAFLLNEKVAKILTELKPTGDQLREILNETATQKELAASAADTVTDEAPNPAPEEKASKETQAKQEASTIGTLPSAPVQPSADEIDVLIVTLTGRAPVLKVEQLPFPIGNLNYTTFELPSLNPPQGEIAFDGVRYNGQSIPPVKLLSADKMAYKTLRDEMPAEIALALVRAITKGAAAYAAQEAGGAFAGLATSIALHITSYQMQLSYRNWEMLPNSGYLSAFHARRDADVILNVGENVLTIPVQENRKGVIVLVSAISPNNVRVDHVSY